MHRLFVYGFNKEEGGERKKDAENSILDRPHCLLISIDRNEKVNSKSRIANIIVGCRWCRAAIDYVRIILPLQREGSLTNDGFPLGGKAAVSDLCQLRQNIARKTGMRPLRTHVHRG